MRLQWLIEDIWYSLKALIIQPNSYIMKNIPHTWRDKDYIIETVLYNCIVDYVEKEEALKVIDWSETEESRNAAKMIKKIYNWVKVGRVQLQQAIRNSYPKDIESDRVVTQKSYDELYGKSDKLEAILNKKDAEYLTWIVVNREILWT